MRDIPCIYAGIVPRRAAAVSFSAAQASCKLELLIGQCAGLQAPSKTSEGNLLNGKTSRCDGSVLLLLAEVSREGVGAVPVTLHDGLELRWVRLQGPIDLEAGSCLQNTRPCKDMIFLITL